MTRDEIAANVRLNLADAGVTFYSAPDINDAIQDGYDDVAVVSGCIQKSATVTFVNELSYYNLRTLISDFYSFVAGYNNNSNRWLIPTSRRELDKTRDDWELWVGQPEFFFPSDPLRVCIVPKLTVATGNFTCFYRATAPTLSGATTPLIHTDEQVLLEWYATADLLDQMEEWTKAEIWWTKYFNGLEKYRARIISLAKSDYLPTVEPC